MDEQGSPPPPKTFDDGFRAGVAEGHAEGVRVGISMALAELRPIIERLEALAYDEAKEPEDETNVVPLKVPVFTVHADNPAHQGLSGHKVHFAVVDDPDQETTHHQGDPRE